MRTFGVRINGSVMPRVHFRWILPCGHGVVDCILLLAWIGYLSGTTKQALVSGPSISVKLAQEQGAVEFDIRYLPPPGPVLLLTTGNLPAGLISTAIRPDAGFERRGQAWDRTWLLLHEALSALSWFLLGLWIDLGGKRLRVPMLLYLVARSAFAVIGVYEVGWRMQIVCWMAFALSLTIIAILRPIRWLIVRGL